MEKLNYKPQDIICRVEIKLKTSMNKPQQVAEYNTETEDK